MRLLQGLILTAVLLDATLVLTATASPMAGAEQTATADTVLGPNAALMAAR